MPFSQPPAGDRCINRAVEWLAATLLLSFALTAFVSPDSVEDSNYRYITQLGFSPVGFAVVTAASGLVRVSALYFNGYGLPWSSRVRAAGAMIGSLMFALMGLSLAYSSREAGFIPLPTVGYFVFAAFELYSCMRAGADVYEKYRRDALAAAVNDARCTRDNGQRTA